jgi:hypothetical protein
MRKLALKTVFITSVSFTSVGIEMHAQDSKIIVEQNPKIENLLKEKQKLNTSLTVNDSYKIQIFYGSSEEAKKKNAEFKKEFKDIETTIIYTNPTFKVWVGNYKLRIHAEKALIDIKNKYPTALLIKPSK